MTDKLSKLKEDFGPFGSRTACLPGSSRKQALAQGVPDFILKLAGWKRLRTLPPEPFAALRHRCD